MKLAPHLLALRDAVNAAPGDRALHLIFADALIEAGEPQGEFIVRQSVDPTAVPSPRLMRQLLGPLSGKTVSQQFTLGVLRGVALQPLGFLPLLALAGRPQWASVTSLTISSERTARHCASETLKVISSPVCRGLREVLDLNGWVLRGLLAQQRHLDRIGIVSSRNASVEPLGHVHLEFDTLHVDAVGATDWLEDLGRPVLEKATTLELSSWSLEAFRLLGLKDLRLAQVKTEMWNAVRHPDGWAVEFPSAIHEEIAVRISGALRRARPPLHSLRMTIAGTTATANRMRKVLGRVPVELSLMDLDDYYRPALEAIFGSPLPETRGEASRRAAVITP